ncbi:hypothetical protein KPL74_10390 [Bacillus sp. NP157]|nr:hypothetical protein KPL74_10390 [Bacillus sp. NP157]
MAHAGLMMDAAALDAATMVGDFDEARLIAVEMVGTADRAGMRKVAESAAHLALALGPKGERPIGAYGDCLHHLATSLDAAKPRHR